ncbi:hypothetical protein [Rhizobium sp. 2MFCol3.1]|uniref:hypothetical protein n=1 Tax=Rhizobium sp. 2MFCol3.1 TaxID=1246459 RepID=UPI00035E0C6F|nr:hypothetical protein [Rhizobium sp. 2MFCol3.1]
MQITSSNIFELMTRTTLKSGSTQKDATTLSSDQVWSADRWRQLADDGDAEARAAQKIADAKEELEFLRRSGFPPDVVVRLAQELLHKISSAMGEYGASAADHSDPLPGDVQVQPVTASQSSDTSVSTHPDTADAGKIAQVNGAYLSVMDDKDRSGLPQGNDETNDSFRSLRTEIRALIAKAERERGDQSP